MSPTTPKRDALRHARTLLGHINADIGLLQLSATFRQSPLKVNGWKRGELRRWCLDRVKAISGTASLDEALRHPDVLTLLALRYLALES